MRRFFILLILSVWTAVCAAAAGIAVNSAAPGVQPFVFTAYAPELRQHFANLPGYEDVFGILGFHSHDIPAEQARRLEDAAGQFLNRNLYLFEALRDLGVRPLSIDPRHPEAWEDPEEMRLDYADQIHRFQRQFNQHVETARQQARDRAGNAADGALARADAALRSIKSVSSDELAKLAMELSTIRKFHEGYIGPERRQRIDETVEWLNGALQTSHLRGAPSPERASALAREVLGRLGLSADAAPALDVSDARLRFEREILGPLREMGVDAGRLPYLLSPNGEKTRQVIVLLHGTGESPAPMAPLAEFDRAQGHNVLSVLLDGHGRTNEALEGVPLENWRRDVDRAVEFARQLGDEVVLAGFSLGAILAVDAAARHDLAGLLLLSPVLKFSAAMTRHFQGRLDEGQRWSTDQEIEGNHFVNRLLPMTAYRALIELTGRVQQAFEAAVSGGASFGIPIAIVASEADKFPDIDFLRRFAAFHGADLTLFTRGERVRHGDMLHPPRIEEAYRRFMARLTRSNP